LTEGSPRRVVPGTGLSLFPLVLGGNVFGWSADESASFAVLDAYVDAGGNAIDTADVYCAWLGTSGGESETIIGRWLASRRHRDRLIIATKMGKAPGLDNLRPSTIRAAVEGSLRRLQADHIDLYYAHRDHDDPLGPALETFDALVREGKVRHLAASNYPPARLAEALDLSEARGWSPFVALQPEYHLMARDSYDDSYAPLCLARGVGTLPYYALARGFLTGKYRRGDDSVSSVRAEAVERFRTPRGYDVLDVVHQVAIAHATTPGAVALAWLLTRPAVVAPIASARTPDQLVDLLPMADLTLEPDEIAALDAVSAPSSDPGAMLEP
jgi:aryl-alcohol dehydrogenase-like predicted oxidoreductase